MYFWREMEKKTRRKLFQLLLIEVILYVLIALSIAWMAMNKSPF